MPYEVTAGKTFASKHKETVHVETEEEATKEFVRFVKKGLICVDIKELE